MMAHYFHSSYSLFVFILSILFAQLVLASPELLMPNYLLTRCSLILYRHIQHYFYLFFINHYFSGWLNPLFILLNISLFVSGFLNFNHFKLIFPLQNINFFLLFMILFNLKGNQAHFLYLYIIHHLFK